MTARTTRLTVSVESTFDQEDGVWDVVASAVDAGPAFRGFGRHEHHVDAQAMALRELADRIDGTPRGGEVSAKQWWRVTGGVTVSAYVYVQAESADEAKRVARGRNPALAPYGASRSGVNPTEEAVIEDADGAFVPDDAEVDDPPAEFGEEE